MHVIFICLPNAVNALLCSKEMQYFISTEKTMLKGREGRNRPMTSLVSVID